MLKKLIFLILLSLLSSICYSLEIKYPLNKSIVLSQTLKMHIHSHRPECASEAWKFLLIGKAPMNDTVLKYNLQNSYGSNLYFAIQLPKLDNGFFEINISSETCGTNVITLYKFNGSAFTLGEKIFNHYQKIHSAESLSYNWTSAVFLYGLAEFIADKDSKTVASEKEYIENFYKHQIRRGIPEITSPDLASISLPAAIYLKQNPQADFLNPIFEKTLKFFENEPINSLGAFNHIGNRHRFYWFMPLTKNFVKDSIWVDSLIMYALNGLMSSPYFKSEKIKEFSEQQPLIFSKFLQDSSGFFKHGYYLDSQERTPHRSYWARGNGWAAVALIQFYEQNLKFKDEYKSSLEKLLFSVSESLDSPIKVSNTLLKSDSKYNYRESSSTALLAYALAKAERLKALPQRTGDLANQMAIDLGGYIVVDDEEQNFSIYQISRPTDSFNFDWYYTLLIRTDHDVSYGVGALLLMLKEMENNGVHFGGQ